MTLSETLKQLRPAMVFETLSVREQGAVLFANIAAPPMNLLGTELIRTWSP